eukprot:TRINITY_DN20618_c0_g1_i1.p1 TRINITY_DN20618_c0_g1~~TRINITY_DN20618_c0_g1_i1.p1  ORF type:complete len:227 (+),score=52.05 TRINITY_DN20618_c0_g1_i1:112-792(+)
MIRRPPRSTHCISSAASDVYKRQGINAEYMGRELVSSKLKYEDFIKKSDIMVSQGQLQQSKVQLCAENNIPLKLTQNTISSEDSQDNQDDSASQENLSSVNLIKSKQLSQSQSKQPSDSKDNIDVKQKKKEDKGKNIGNCYKKCLEFKLILKISHLTINSSFQQLIFTLINKQIQICISVYIYIYTYISVSYTHLRAHETRHDLVCRLLLEKKKKLKIKTNIYHNT